MDILEIGPVHVKSFKIDEPWWKLLNQIVLLRDRKSAKERS